MAFILIGNQYTASEFGKTDKLVHCEKCGAEYRYTMFRMAQANAIAPLFGDKAAAVKQAGERAKARLQGMLERGADPIPCPSCGHFQGNMVREARRRHLRWMKTLGLWGLVSFPAWALVLIIVNATFAAEGSVVPWWIVYLILGCALAVFMGLLTVRMMLVLRYHPEDEPGDILFRKGYCGGTLLRDSEGNELPAPEPLSADELESMAKLVTEFISCEECHQEYQDFSWLGPTYLRGVAPCPTCGHVQQFMFHAAQSKKRGPWASSPRRFMSVADYFLLGALLFLPFCISIQTDWGHPRDEIVFEDEFQESVVTQSVVKKELFWSIEAGLLFAGAVLMLTGWLRLGTYDPNTQSRDTRLAIAKNVSKTRAEVEATGGGSADAPLLV